MTRLLCIVISCLLLGACVSTPCVRWAGAARWCAAPLPEVPPFSRSDDVVSADARGEQLQVLATTEWTRDSFTQAVLTPFGQRLYRLQYDGRRIQFDAGLLPVPIQPEQSLLDIQLMLWPRALLLPQLPRGWQLQENTETGARTLRAGKELLAEVRRLSKDEVELIQHRLGYRVRVQTLEQTP
jgi:hypothetical protein